MIFGKIYTKLGKIRPFLGLGMLPVTGGIIGQIKPLSSIETLHKHILFNAIKHVSLSNL